MNAPSNVRCVGVTKVLNQLDKPGLYDWWARTAAKTAIEEFAKGASFEVAVNRALIAPKTARQKAAVDGTRAHDKVNSAVDGAADVVDLGNVRSHDAATRVVAYLEDNGWRVHDRDVPLQDICAGYMGKLDLVVERDGQLFVAEIKTGDRIYDDVVIQLGAYRALWLLNRPAYPIAGAIVFHAPVVAGDLVVTEHHVSRSALDAGAAVFAALLAIRTMRKVAVLSTSTESR